MRFIIPSCNYKKAERIALLFDCIEKWIDSDDLLSLVDLFGGKPIKGSLSDKLDYLNDFVQIWDYRKKLVNTNLINERWNISDNEFVIEHSESILIKSSKLGLVEGTKPIRKPDFILPLGGARYSNLDRPMYAKALIDEFGYRDISIVALSGTRPINEKERVAIDSYACGAITEFDALNCGLVRTFDLGNDFDEQVCENENINLCSSIRQYIRKYNGITVYSLAAPSKDAAKRANSRDTFEFFLKTFNVKNRSKLLLVTSQIYVPYQLLKFADLAIDGQFDVDCVGSEMDTLSSLSKPSNYLQEIKGTINAMTMLYKKYRE